MSTTLENFVIAHPAVTLSHTDYGQQFHLGTGVHIVSSPTQRLQSFVENGTGSPHRFLIIGQLSSFRIVEDPVCAQQAFDALMTFTRRDIQFGHFLSVNLGQFTSQTSTATVFSDIFLRQVETLRRIELDDGMDSDLLSQVWISA